MSTPKEWETLSVEERHKLLEEVLADAVTLSGGTCHVIPPAQPHLSDTQATDRLAEAYRRTCGESPLLTE